MKLEHKMLLHWFGPNAGILMILENQPEFVLVYSFAICQTYQIQKDTLQRLVIFDKSLLVEIKNVEENIP